MTRKLAAYIEEGKTFDADEREIVALALQRVGESEQAAVATAWDAVIDSRVEEIATGAVQLVSGHETLEMARAMVVNRRDK